LRFYANNAINSPVAVHLLTTALLILAFFATILHLLHREDRRDLLLRHEPGTIASAVSIGAQTGVGEVLAGRHAEKDIADALKNKKFRIDPGTMKIVMEGEHGYEDAKSPVFRRESVIQHMLHRPRRRTGPGSPLSATPSSPVLRTVDLQVPGTPNFKEPTTPIISTPRARGSMTPLVSPNLQAPGSPFAPPSTAPPQT